MFNRPFMLRVAGLPFESVRALRCEEARRWADEVLAGSARLAAAGEAVGDLLHDVVGRCEDPAARRKVLALRREVFNNRLPRGAEAGLDLVRALDAEVAGSLARWLADRRQLADRTAEGAALLETDVTRTRAVLRRLAGEERLRAGLLLASPTLDAQMDAFVRDEAPKPSKKTRKIERSLLSYLYRTACKTSPFSTFTGVALGEFTDGAGDRTIRIDESWTGRSRLNVVALGRLAEAVVADPARRADLPVALATGWGIDDDRVRYVRRWVTAGDDDTAVTFDAVKDRLFFLRRSGTLERMLGLFAQEPEIRYGELAAWLAEAEADAAPEEAERYLSALFDVGMLQVRCLRTDVHDEDPLRAFQEALRAVRRPWADTLADGLEGPIGCVDRFPGADPAGRRALLAELRAQLAALQEGLGAARARVPQTVLYEDVAAGRGVRCDREAWNAVAAAPLRALEQIMPAFDLTLAQRVTFKGFFTARYGRGGRCDDLLKLVHDFHEDFFDQYLSFTAKRKAFDEHGTYTPQENWLHLPQIKALDAARVAFVERMRELWEKSGDEPEIFLDARMLAEVRAELESVVPDFTALSHHVQLAERDGDPLVVLNRTFGGLSFPFSRFTHLFDGVAEDLRHLTRRAQPGGAVFAEITGGPVTSNLNLHGRLTDYEIVCPGETGAVPEEYQLKLDDLYLTHDPASDRLVLRSSRLDREVVPVYLGYLVPLALPEVPRTLLLLSPTTISPLKVWEGVPEGQSTGGVTRRPRVRHGSVVLSRRSWRAPAAVLPLRRPEQSDADWFLEWHRWRRAHELPDQVFGTVTAAGSRGATGGKPSYVDFDSYLSLTAFEALLKDEEADVTFREMLPEQDALHTVSDRGHHVAELAVETVVSTSGKDLS
jgi:hypothetical protein